MDVDYILNLYMWEFEALFKGVQLRLIDEREQAAIHLFNERYVMNDKRPKLKKIFDRKRLEERLNKSPDSKRDMNTRISLRERASKLFS